MRQPRNHGAARMLALAQELRSRSVPDMPSTEPLADLQAQIADMHDSATPRRAVYLSAANLRHHGPEAVRSLSAGGVAIPNFDGKGGVLIVPNAKAAQQARELRQSDPNMQRVLGLLTGAGTGKSWDGIIAVQGRTPAGAVATEGMVRPDQVPERLAAVRAQGKTPAVLPLTQAIGRRMSELQRAK